MANEYLPEKLVPNAVEWAEDKDFRSIRPNGEKPISNITHKVGVY